MTLPFHGTDSELQWRPLTEKADRPQGPPEPSTSHHTSQRVQDAHGAHILIDELPAIRKSGSSWCSHKKHLGAFIRGHYALMYTVIDETAKGGGWFSPKIHSGMRGRGVRA
jgi:hypothetical protein